MTLVETLLAVVAALVPLIAAAVKAWLDDRPSRKAREIRRENLDVSKEVAGARAGDDAAAGRLNRRLRTWMAEDD